MNTRLCSLLLPALALGLVTAFPAQAQYIDAPAVSMPEPASPPPMRYRLHRGYSRPLPERHVVEKVSPPGSGNYLINNTWFTARTASCARWVAGDRIRLVAGDWHGYCQSAVFHNLSRRQSCELSCGWW
jgi:hypothetical protein